MDIRHMRETLKMKIEEQDPDFQAKDEIVTREIFFIIMKDNEVWDALANIEVDIPSLIDNATTIFESDNASHGLHFSDLVDVLLKFRATDSSMIKVIFEVRALVYDRMATVDKKLESISGLLHVAHAHGKEAKAEMQHEEEVLKQEAVVMHSDLEGIKRALKHLEDHELQHVSDHVAEHVQTRLGTGPGASPALRDYPPPPNVEAGGPPLDLQALQLPSGNTLADIGPGAEAPKVLQQDNSASSGSA